MESSQKISRRRKKPDIPDYVKDKPELDVSLQFYWGSFFRLSSERKYEGGAIPYSSIQQHAQFNNISDLDDFYEIMSTMDREFVSLQGERNGLRNRD